MHGQHCYTDDGLLTCGWPEQHLPDRETPHTLADMVEQLREAASWQNYVHGDGESFSRMPRVHRRRATLVPAR